MENVDHSVWYIVCTKSSDYSLGYKEDVIPSISHIRSHGSKIPYQLPILKNWKWILSEMNMGNT